MKEEQSQQESESKSVSRRELFRKGVKAAYVAPVVLAAVSTSERPALAGFSDPN